MIDLKSFRKSNGLRQADVATYLKVNPSYIANVETGRATLSAAKVEELLTNTEGWDISNLIKEEPKIVTNNYQSTTGDNSPLKIVEGTDTEELIRLRTENEMLSRQVEEQKETIARYWAMIEKLTK